MHRSIAVHWRCLSHLLLAAQHAEARVRNDYSEAAKAFARAERDKLESL
jgi:hypothetical protein